VTIVESNAANIEIARALLRDLEVNSTPGFLRFVHGTYPASAGDEADVLIVPLAFSGDRKAIYRHPPAPTVLVHDWMWARRGRGVRVSWLLLKRINLIRETRYRG